MTIRDIIENIGFAILGAGLVLLALLAGLLYYKPYPVAGTTSLLIVIIATILLGVIYLIFARLVITTEYPLAGDLALIGALVIGFSILYAGYPLIKLALIRGGILLPEGIAWLVSGATPILAAIYLYSKR